MEEQHHGPEGTPPYEDKPIALGPVVKATVALFAVTGFVLVLMWGEFTALDSHKKSVDPRVSPLMPKKQIPPGPHLEAQKPSMTGSENEPFEPKNLIASRTQERNILESYSWVDEKSGVVRIPIEEAMKKVVQIEAHNQTQPAPATQTAESPAK